tara:strand:- start:250 stop:528 length:279 start_codon:yes stop_codon:yes gene_type:complete
MITVNNVNKDSMDVAINRWGSDGSTDFFTISSEEKETWDRTNGMGFVMVITNRGDSRNSGSYWFVKNNATITISSLNNVSGAMSQLVNPYES